MTTLINPSYIKDNIMKNNNAKLSRSHQAINYYTRVIDLGTTLNNLAYTLYMRGCTYEAVGNIEEACLDWNEAKKLNMVHSLGVDFVEEALSKYQIN